MSEKIRVVFLDIEGVVRDPRTLLIDAICGIRVSDMDTCDKLTRLGYMEFCGNQWNEDWRWVRKNLEHAQTEMLEKIYNQFRGVKT